LLTAAQLQTKAYDEALKSARELVKRWPDSFDNVDLLASILLIRGDNRAAYEVYEAYYEKHHDVPSLLKMASILYHRLHDPEATIQLLESHRKMIGCEERLCLFLAELRRQRGELEAMADVFADLYRVTKQTDYAKRAAEIDAYFKHYDKAEAILKDSGADDKLLLSIYKYTKQYDKAKELAKRLYDETNDPLWLAEHGVLTYETAKNRQDPKMLKQVVKELSEALHKGVKDPLYFNYLGYLLIDHDLDVAHGVDLVKKALEAEPDSVFFLDSLAWGYYKLHQCGKAYDIMEKVVAKTGTDEPEIGDHWKKIKACRSGRP
jgi:predicted Zn-dependent protease